jgi:hypothetical protein
VVDEAEEEFRRKPGTFPELTERYHALAVVD